jgi:uncharacterized protein
MRMRVICLGVVAGCAGLLALAGPASAHITVSAPDATRGGSDVVITFRVPTEKDTASTVGLKVQLPAKTPIANVLVQAMPGWTHTQKMVKLATPISTDDGDITEAVSEIDWTATSGAIKPGEFAEFVAIAGLLPDTPQLSFPVIQTYSDGSQVDWTEVPAPGSTAEPEHPAPTLKLGAASSSDALTASAAPAASSGKGSSQTGSVVLASIALAVAVVALGATFWKRRDAR